MKLQFVIPKGWHRLRVGTYIQWRDRYPDSEDNEWAEVFDWIDLHDVKALVTDYPVRTGEVVIRRNKK